MAGRENYTAFHAVVVSVNVSSRLAAFSNRSRAQWPVSNLLSVSTAGRAPELCESAKGEVEAGRGADPF